MTPICFSLSFLLMIDGWLACLWSKSHKLTFNTNTDNTSNQQEKRSTRDFSPQFLYVPMYLYMCQMNVSITFLEYSTFFNQIPKKSIGINLINPKITEQEKDENEDDNKQEIRFGVTPSIILFFYVNLIFFFLLIFSIECVKTSRLSIIIQKYIYMYILLYIPK